VFFERGRYSHSQEKEYRITLAENKCIGAVSGRSLPGTCSGWLQVVAPKAGAQATLHHPAAHQQWNKNQLFQ
jgi:hypothetical protein